jgi:hypothetical protein
MLPLPAYIPELKPVERWSQAFFGRDCAQQESQVSGSSRLDIISGSLS